MTWANIENILKGLLIILTVLGGTGGIAYWIGLYKNRMRVKIRDFGYKPFTSQGKLSTIEFEVENLGLQPSSLESDITASSFYAKTLNKKDKLKWRRRSFQYKILDSDRTLQINTPKVFTAQAPSPPDIPFEWYLTFKIKLTRGRSKKIRIRSATGTKLNLIRFYLELIYLFVYRDPLIFDES